MAHNYDDPFDKTSEGEIYGKSKVGKPKEKKSEKWSYL
jgi:hypothetical protein